MKEFAEIKHEYLSYIASVRALSPKTVLAYEEDLRKFEGFLKERNADFRTLSRQEVRRFLAELQRQHLSVATVNRVLSGIKGLYSYAVRYGIVETDPFDRVTRLKEQRKLPSVLTEEEIHKLLEAPGEDFFGLRDSVIFQVLYATGCRLSELLDMNTDAVDLSAGRISVRGKGDKDRFVYLTDSAVHIVELYLPLKEAYQEKHSVAGDHRKALIINTKGRRISPQGVHYIFERYTNMLGLSKHVTPHTLRHTFATHILDRDAGIRVVQELLGHEHISTTQIYSHVGIERLRNVYERSHPHGRRKR